MLGYTRLPVEMSMHGTRCLKMLFTVKLEPHSRDLLIELIFLSFCMVNPCFSKYCRDGEASVIYGLLLPLVFSNLFYFLFWIMCCFYFLLLDANTMSLFLFFLQIPCNLDL